jgi:hypothetical protein
MRTAGERFAPPSDLDDAWRDLISSAPAPPPPMPRDVSVRISVPAEVTTNRQGCVTRVQFGGDIIVPTAPEKPTYDATDRRLWKVAGALMALATLVLLVLGMLTFRGGESVAMAPLPPSPPVVVSARVTAPAPPAETTPADATGVGQARPLIAQHALRHSSTKHARKHRKMAER